MARSSAAATDNHSHQLNGGRGGGGGSIGVSGGVGMIGSNENMLSVRSWGALVALSHAEEQLALAFAFGPSHRSTTGGGEGTEGEALQRRWLREWTRLCCLGDLHGKVMIVPMTALMLMLVLDTLYML